MFPSKWSEIIRKRREQSSCSTKRLDERRCLDNPIKFWKMPNCEQGMLEGSRMFSGYKIHNWRIVDYSQSNTKKRGGSKGDWTKESDDLEKEIRTRCTRCAWGDEIWHGIVITWWKWCGRTPRRLSWQRMTQRLVEKCEVHETKCVIHKIHKDCQNASIHQEMG